MLPPDLVPFVEAGVSVLVGSRDQRLLPESVRAFGARVARTRRELTVFVPVATGATTIANLEDNGRIAICFCLPRDHHTIQVKGQVLSIRPATARDRARVERYREQFGDELAWVGLPLRVSRRFSHWPCHAVRMKVESVFDQTPGPGAGDPLPRVELR
ncbi:MAG: hypothetical protein KAI24_22805, partial [Planctomycetes bacterium]|nr:hypothetical protein [Planctomycetota bacterium]